MSARMFQARGRREARRFFGDIQPRSNDAHGLRPKESMHTSEALRRGRYAGFERIGGPLCRATTIGQRRARPRAKGTAGSHQIGRNPHPAFEGWFRAATKSERL